MIHDKQSSGEIGNYVRRLGRVPEACTVVGAWVTPDDAFASDAGEYLEIIFSRWVDGAPQGNVARVTTEPREAGGSGDWTPGRPVYLTLEDATDLRAGDTVLLEVLQRGPNGRPMGRAVYQLDTMPATLPA